MLDAIRTINATECSHENPANGLGAGRGGESDSTPDEELNFPLPGFLGSSTDLSDTALDQDLANRTSLRILLGFTHSQGSRT